MLRGKLEELGQSDEGVVPLVEDGDGGPAIAEDQRPDTSEILTVKWEEVSYLWALAMVLGLGLRLMEYSVLLSRTFQVVSMCGISKLSQMDWMWWEAPPD